MFKWKDTEDTSQSKLNNLPKITPKIMFGKGTIGGLDNNVINNKSNSEAIKARVKKLMKKNINISRIITVLYCLMLANNVCNAQSFDKNGFNINPPISNSSFNTKSYSPSSN